SCSESAGCLRLTPKGQSAWRLMFRSVCFGHWISAVVTRQLKTARPLPPTDELLRRQTALEAAIREYPARRAEALRQRGMLPPADFVVGDLTKGGRDATPAELAALSGRQSNGVPIGLALCADCGLWKGQ